MSRLDLDFYKLTMGQLVWRRHRDVPVRYAFVNRTRSVRLAERIDVGALRAQLDETRAARVAPEDLAWLAQLRAASGEAPRFAGDYLAFLGALELPPVRVDAGADGQLAIEVSGRWAEALYWETSILGAVNELLGRSALAERGADALVSEGVRRLRRKVELLEAQPSLRIAEVGTRRRFSREWQEHVVGTLARRVPGALVGTSNVALARRLGLAPLGTFGHELFMGVAALRGSESDAALRAAPGEVLDAWWSAYGPDLAYALTDTYGSDFFFRDFGAARAHAWRGLRHDSGDPIAFGEAALAFYERLGVDARDKTLVFSDGLDEDRILRLAERFGGRARLLFGWGTHLTNDLGVEPLSLVVKLVEVDGRPAVKLSDNRAKALGDPTEIARYERVFGYASAHHDDRTG